MGLFNYYKESKKKKTARQDRQLRAEKSLEGLSTGSYICALWGVFFLFIELIDVQNISFIHILVGIGFLLVGGALYLYRRNILNKWARYDALINPQYGSISIENMCLQTGRNKDEIIADLQKMMNVGYYPGAYFDYANSRFIIDDSNPNVEEPFAKEEYKEESFAETEMDNVQDLIARTIQNTHDDEIKTKLKVISDLYSRVTDMNDDHDMDASGTVEKFETLYIPKTIDIIERHQSLPASGDNSTRGEVISVLDSLTTGIINLLAEMTSHEQIDLSSEIDALKTMLSLDGYDQHKR